MDEQTDLFGELHVNRKRARAIDPGLVSTPDDRRIVN